MQVTLFGAAGNVTGSCYCIETSSAKMLVDCGMFQGSQKIERMNKIPRYLISKPVDLVVLTHAHLDHCGRLPLLVKTGFTGPIYATAATIDIAQLILRDAAKIQEQDAERANRLYHRAKWQRIEPLFTAKDADAVHRLMRPLQYNHWLDIAPGVKIQLVEAGHILGSASVQMVVNQNGGRRNLVFSGDLGGWNAPIMRDPARLDYADYVFIESTYGDRDHRNLAATLEELEQLIQKAVDNKGKILVPTFAVGRAQQILYHMAAIFRKHNIKPFPIYLDSPMAIAATELYRKHQNLMDEEARDLHSSGQLQADLSTVIPCITADESRALNTVEGPCLILAGAGMCNAGRILHHLRHNLANPTTIVLIVGYQAKGSVGRLLVDGASYVKIMGETVPVRATVAGLGGFSAHAGQTDLLRWLEPMARHSPRVIIMHGEDHPRNLLANKIQERFNIRCELPKHGELLNL